MSNEISDPVSSITPDEGDRNVDEDQQELATDAIANAIDLSSNNTIDLTNATVDVDFTDNKNHVDHEADEKAFFSQTGNDYGSSSDAHDHIITLNAVSTIDDVLKRSNNYPYESNQWERFESVEFCAYRVLPNDMSLNGRAFAISVFLKSFDCRFNCGDIVDLKDGTKVVFLGIRYEADNCSSAAAAVLLYFFKLNSNAGTTLGENCSKELILKNLILLRIDQLIEFFPAIKREEGLMYVEPGALEITTVMTQLRSVLFEYKTLAELEQGTSISTRKPPVVDLSKQPVKKTSSMEPSRPLSIRQKGNKPPTSILSGTSKLSESMSNNKRAYVVPPAANSPVNSRKRSATELSRSDSDSSEIEYAEDSLMLKTKDNLFAICKNLQIDVSRSCKKDAIISAILRRKNQSKNKILTHHHRERIELNGAGYRGTDVTSLRTASRLEEPSISTMQTHIAANIGKAMDGIESRLSNNLTACVSETKRQSTQLQEELVATKATLAAERQQKKEFQKEATETLHEHVEIFGKISESATKPLMEVMRLFTQTNVAAIEKSISSNSVKTDTSPQPLVLPSSSPMILHHQHHHAAVLPSPNAYGPFPSLEQLMLYPYSANPQMIGHTHLSTPMVMPSASNITQMLHAIQQHPGTYFPPANQMASLPPHILHALTPSTAPSIANTLSQLQMGQGPQEQQNAIVSAVQQLILQQQQIGGMSNATTTAVNATSSSSASSSLLPQHQQAPVHHNNHPHPLASTLQQQLFQQSPPHTSFVNHPMMVQSLQAQCAAPGSSSSSVTFPQQQLPPQGNNTQSPMQLLEALFFNK